MCGGQGGGLHALCPYAKVQTIHLLSCRRPNLAAPSADCHAARSACPTNDCCTQVLSAIPTPLRTRTQAVRPAYPPSLSYVSYSCHPQVRIPRPPPRMTTDRLRLHIEAALPQ